MLPPDQQGFADRFAQVASTGVAGPCGDVVEAIPYLPDSGFGAPALLEAHASNSNSCELTCPAGNSDFALPASSPNPACVVALADGTFVAVWSDQAISGYCSAPVLYTEQFVGAPANASGWGAPFFETAVPAGPTSLDGPNLESLGVNGTTVLAAWENFGDAGGSFGVNPVFELTALQAADATWEIPQVIEAGLSQPSTTEYRFIGLSLALGPNGNGFVTWHLPAVPNGGQTEQPLDEYVAQISGLTVGPTVNLTAACSLYPDPANSVLVGTVAVNGDGDGGAAAVWATGAFQAGANATATAVLESIYSTDGGWGPCASIGIDAGPRSFEPANANVAELGNGS